MRGKHCSLLYVSGDKKASRYFKRVFKEKFRILTATSVIECREVLREKAESVSVLIVDQGALGIGPVRLLEEAKEKYAKIVRVLITDNSSHEELITAINSQQVDRVVEKPWTDQTMEAVLVESEKLRLERRVRVESNDLLATIFEESNLQEWIAELPFKEAKRKFADVFEVIYLKNALVRNKWNVSRTAIASKIDRKTIQRIRGRLKI